MAAWNPKANEIFLDAVEIDAGRDRDAFLAEACGGDAELRAAVDSLLAANQDAGSFMNDGAPGIAATIDAPAAPPVGIEIGPYKLREQIGEGGFGVVYVAEQTEPVSRKVALKIIKPGMDTKQVIARFEAERQALALMDHPNVAKVLDAGAAESGRPYFVMELVRGVPITDFCDEQKLSTRERLQLFVDVCRAVQHAHQKGIIHRDLKPSNVMVTLHDDKPIPKVIDFGVSKALASKLSEKTVYTAYGQMVGTPLYMSPEQAQLSGLDVDTRSDVYSLGVLLYELLTGTTPFDKETLKEVGFDDMRRIICEVDPPRPSARVSTLQAGMLSTVSDKRKIDPRKLSASLRGELDWIVMKALAKDRNRRYESPSAFAADVERYLTDEPVDARPASAWYRLAKFARRKKAALVACALVAVFVLTIAGGLGWIVRDRGIRQTRVVAQVDLILDDVDRLMRDQKWPEALATAKRAEAALESGDADAATQQRVQQVLADLKLVQRLEDAWSLYSQAGEGTFNPAGAERAYADAFTDAGLTVEGLTVEQAAAQLRAREAIATELATGLTDWARLRTFTTAGTRDTSWKHLLAVADAVDPDSWRRRLRATWQTKGGANTLRELADSADVRMLPPSTVVLLGRLLRYRVSPQSGARLLLKAQHHHPGDFWINFDLASCLMVSTPEQFDEAVVFLHAALAIRPRNAAVWNNLGNAVRGQKKPDAAIACYRKAIEFAPKSAAFHSNLGVALCEQNKLAEGIACFHKAIELDPKYALAHYSLGLALHKQKKLDAAIARYREAIKLYPKYADAHNNLGAALQQQGKLDAAIACYREFIELQPKDAKAHNNLGLALTAQRKLDAAIACFRKAIELEPKFADAHYNLGVVLHEQGKLDAAIACYRKAIELEPKSAALYNILGLALHTRGRLDEAIDSFREAIKLNPKHAGAQFNLGNTLLQQDKLDAAIACYHEAVKLRSNDARYYNNLGYALKARNRLPEAIAAYREAIELDPKLAPTYTSLTWLLATAEDVELRDPKEALELAREAVELDPKDANQWDNLGVALYRNDEFEAAVETLEKARAMRDGKDPWHRFFLAMAYWKVGREQDALAEYALAVSWLDEEQRPPEQSRFRDEAEALIGSDRIRDAQKPTTVPGEVPK